MMYQQQRAVLFFPQMEIADLTYKSVRIDSRVLASPSHISNISASAFILTSMWKTFFLRFTCFL